MTTIKINIIDDINLSYEKKNTQVTKKKHSTSLEEVTRHQFLPGAKNKNIHVSRLAEVTRGSKKSP